MWQFHGRISVAKVASRISDNDLAASPIMTGYFNSTNFSFYYRKTSSFLGKLIEFGICEHTCIVNRSWPTNVHIDEDVSVIDHSLHE